MGVVTHRERFPRLRENAVAAETRRAHLREGSIARRSRRFIALPIYRGHVARLSAPPAYLAGYYECARHGLYFPTLFRDIARINFHRMDRGRRKGLISPDATIIAVSLADLLDLRFGTSGARCHALFFCLLYTSRFLEIAGIAM